jgi:hypothetical protein
MHPVSSCVHRRLQRSPVAGGRARDEGLCLPGKGLGRQGREGLELEQKTNQAEGPVLPCLRNLMSFSVKIFSSVEVWWEGGMSELDEDIKEQRTMMTKFVEISTINSFLSHSVVLRR